jgi:hypothetical protein
VIHLEDAGPELSNAFLSAPVERFEAPLHRPAILRTVAGAFVLARGHRRVTLRDVPAGASLGAEPFAFVHTAVAPRAPSPASLRETSPRRLLMRELVTRRLLSLSARSGQGTVEYVGLILLVALLMVGMVAAMKGFQGKQGVELAQTIVDKIREAVGQVSFK